MGEMLLTMTGNITISLAASMLQSALHNYFRSFKWNELFTKARKNLIDSYENDENIIRIINTVLDDKALKELEEKYKDYRDIKLINSIKDDISLYFNRCNKDCNSINELVTRFIDALLFHLRTYDSDLYSHICLYQELLKTNEQVQLLNEKYKEITISTYSLWQVEDRLRKSSIYNIDLDFFDFEEKYIDNIIVERLKNESIIHIKCEDQEEGFFYLLRLFKNIPDLCDNVLVINDKSSWELADEILSDKILIPLFEASQIIPSQKSKTIIVLPNHNTYYNDDCIRIPKRTFANLHNSLEKYIIDRDKIDSLLRNKVLNFNSLKHYLFYGQIEEPSWFKNTLNPSIFAPALLLGKWNESKEDTTVLEYISMIPYEDYILKIKEITKTGDSFINCFNSFGDQVYYVVDLKTAWYMLYKYVKKSDLDAFLSLFDEIVLDRDTKIEFGIQSANCGIYSTELKNSIIISLIYISIISEEHNKSIQNSIVNKCLDSLFKKSRLSKCEWRTICGVITKLIEVNPKFIIDVLNKEFGDKYSNIHCLFEHMGSNTYQYDSYPYLLMAIEKALFYEDTKILAINLLQKLCKEPTNSKLVDSPLYTLSKVFSPIMDEIGLSTEERKTLLRSFLNSDKENCWKLLKRILPSQIGSGYEDLSKPQYRIPSYIKTQFSSSDTYNNYKAYIDIGFECANGDLKKLGYILENTVFINFGYLGKFIGSVLHLVSDNTIIDIDKYHFAISVRRFIYRCRFHKLRWYDEEIIKQIEDNVYSQIKYSDSVYNDLYCFELGYTPLNPDEFIDNQQDFSSQWDRNEKAQEIEQVNILRSYYEENIGKLDTLFKIVQDNQQIGISLAKSMDFKLDRKIIEILHKNDKRTILTLYVRNVIFSMEDKEAIEAIKIAFSGFDLKTRFVGLGSLPINDTTIKYIDSLQETERDYYYQNINSWVKGLKRESLKEYFTNLLEANNYEGIRSLMLNNDLEIEDYINLLRSYAFYENNNGYLPLRDYEITKIFKKIYKFNNVSKKLIEDIIQLEIAYSKILYYSYAKPKPQYLIDRLFNDPEYLVKIIKLTCVDDQSEKLEYTQEEVKQIEFYDHIIRYIHFCPCVDVNDNFHSDKWKKWIGDFIIGVTNNNQIRVGLKILGKLFSFFPKGLYPGWLPEEICQLIDDYSDKDLNNYFCNQCLNNRSVHYCNHGNENIPLIEEYKQYAEVLKLNYPVTASIFKELSDYYNYEKKQKREQASHSFF